MPAKRKLGLDDLNSFKNVTDAQISPDGKVIAFCVSALTHSSTRYPPSHIWTVDVKGGEPREFTTGPRTDIQPRWSPDGTMLAFISDRAENGRFQVYVIRREGGEAQQLTFLQGVRPPAREVSHLSWSPDGRYLAFLMQDEEDEALVRRRAAGNDAVEFEHVHRYTRIWVVDVVSKAAHQVTGGNVQVWEFDWSPDGKKFALVASDAPYEWSWYQSRIATVPAKGGTPKTVVVSKKQLAHPRWSPDSKRIAYLTSIWSDRGIVSGDLCVVNERGVTRTLTKGYKGSVGWVQWLEVGDSLLAASYEEGEAALNTFETRTSARRGLWKESVLLAEPFSPRFSAARNTSFAVVRASPSAPRDVWAASENRGRLRWRQLTRMNPSFEEITLGEQQIVEWNSTDGSRISGILIKPPGQSGRRRVPLVVVPHGGPTSLYANGFSSPRDWGQQLAARGMAVLLPNYRGSTGWGIEFAEANFGDLGGKDFEDVMSGVDAMIANGVADPGRLGIGGWSYGGFMTAWAITQSDRFKAAVVGAGITNWLSFHGNSHLNTWDPIHYGESPYERDGLFQKYSAMNYVSQARTPTLVMHGELDRDVPAEQGYQFYRALRDHGVESEFVLYPREEHAVLETAHVHDLLKRMVEWFEGHLC